MGGLTRLASPWAYVVVGLLAAGEAAAFIGLFVPGELALITGGYLAYQGRVSLAVMLAVAAVGAIVGDSIGYEIGRHFGDPLRESRLGRRVGAERWARADAYLARHGGRAVFFGRFIGFLRALVPGLAGTARMPYRRFIAWNALGGVLWAPGCVLIGYVAGSSYRRVEHYAGRASLLLAGVVAAMAGIVAGARWISRHPEQLRELRGRVLDRRIVAGVRRRYRRQLEFLGRRFRPGQALGLSLTIQLAVLGICGWVFGAVVQDVLGGDELARIDGPITRYVVGHRTPWLTTVMKGVTMLGSTWVLVPLLAVVGLWARRRGRGWAPLGLLGAAQLGAIALYDLIKPLVGRPRPALGPLVATATGFSFPSGHATQSAAVYGALAWLLARSARPWGARVAVSAAAVLVALLVGFSRVYLGVHWTSDVVGGWALGTLWLVALLTTTRTITGRRAPVGAGA